MLAWLELVGYGAILGDVGLELALWHGWHLLGVGFRLFHVLGVGGEVGAEVEIMKKSVFVVADVDKGGVEAGQELAHPCQVQVAHGVSGVAALFLERDKSGILKQRYRDFLLANVYYQFAFHR